MNNAANENSDIQRESSLHQWFGLSYASWLTLPRVFMCAMPDDWQAKMKDLLLEYEENFPDGCVEGADGTRVLCTKDRKLVKTPPDLINYRHPNPEFIAKAQMSKGSFSSDGLGKEWHCPSCNADLVGVLYEDPWFVMTGGHPGDSGPNGNTPQEPVAWGIQECHECSHKWEAG